MIQSPVTDSSLPPSRPPAGFGSPRRPVPRGPADPAPLLLWGGCMPSRVSLQTSRGGATRGSQGGLESGYRRRGTPASCPVAATLLGTGSSARGRDPSVPHPPWEELQRVPHLRHPPRGASLPGVPPLLPVSLLRPHRPGHPVPHCGGWGSSPEGFPAPPCLCQNGWWVECGSGVARLEGDSLWELGDVISPKEAPATRR